MSKSIAYAFVVLMLVVVTPSIVQGQIAVDVDINLPAILILSCFDEIDVAITGPNLGALLLGSLTPGGVDSGSITPTATGTSLEGTATSLNTTLAVDPAAISLNLLRVCAVRAIGDGNGVDVSIVPNNVTLNGPGTSQIIVDSVGTRDSGIGGVFGSGFNIPEANLGLGNLRFVDARLQLDLTNANQAGDHTSAAAGTFTITATAP